MKNLWVFALLISMACVPKHKVVYLRDKNIDVKTEMEDHSPQKTITAEYQPYRLQPSDIVSIEIFSLTDISTEGEYNFFDKSNNERSEEQDPLLGGYLISPNGTVDLPVVGLVQIDGLTLDEASKKIREIAGQYLEVPSVVVRILNFNISVLGEVQTPGEYITYDPRINIIQAIAMAGDLTDVADRANVLLLRKEGNSIQKVYIDLLDENLISTEYFYLRPNDQIYVPPLNVKNFRTFQSPNIALFLSALTVITLLLTR